MPVVPHSFLFRFAIPITTATLQSTSGLLEADTLSRVPDFGVLENAQAFAQVRAGWNEEGIGFRVEVTGKKMPLVLDVAQPAESDGFQVWLDTRNTQSVHRATRFCHRFVFLPTAGKKSTAEAIQLPIALAKDDVPSTRGGAAKIRLIRSASQVSERGYVLDVWIPAEVLHGYDPESNPALGFYYVVRDAELGEQFLTVGRDFPFDHDPSLWSTLELTR